MSRPAQGGTPRPGRGHQTQDRGPCLPTILRPGLREVSKVAAASERDPLSAARSMGPLCGIFCHEHWQGTPAAGDATIANAPGLRPAVTGPDWLRQATEQDQPQNRIICMPPGRSGSIQRTAKIRRYMGDRRSDHSAHEYTNSQRPLFGTSGRLQACTCRVHWPVAHSGSAAAGREPLPVCEGHGVLMTLLGSGSLLSPLAHRGGCQ
jgi:hypothetical protein